MMGASIPITSMTEQPGKFTKNCRQKLPAMTNSIGAKVLRRLVTISASSNNVMASGQSRLGDIKAHAATGTSNKPHLLVCHISFSGVVNYGQV
jgi:hypothetical protein